MIVLDTNVLSEPLRRDPDRRVLAWLDQHAEGAYLTCMTAAELRYGAARLPDGRRKRALEQSVERLINTMGDRLLAFDGRSAGAYATMRVQRERDGRPVSAEDLIIASICATHGASLATRNGRVYDGLGLTLIDPWGR